MRDREDHDEGGELLENVQSLINKERELLELQLLEKERELDELRNTVAKQQAQLVKTTTEAYAGVESKKRRRSKKFTFVESESGSSSSSSSSSSDEEEEEKRDLVDFRETLKDSDSLLLANERINESSLEHLLKAIVHAPKLRVLDLSENMMGESCAGILCEILSHPKVGLERVILSRNRFRLSAAQMLIRAAQRNGGIRELDLSENPFSEDGESGKILGAMLAGSGIERIVISIRDPRAVRGSNTKNGNCASFLTSLFGPHSDVSRLGLVQSSIPKVAVSILASEGISKGMLREVDLSMAFIGSSGATILGKALCKAHRELMDDKKSVHKRISVRAASGRETLHFVERLVLKMNGIGPAGSVWIARAIATSRTLQHVDLSSNDLYDGCAAHLAVALTKTSAPLSVLDLAGNPFYRAANDSQRGAQALVTAVKNKQELVSLGRPDLLRFSVGIKRSLITALENHAPRQQGANNAQLVPLLYQEDGCRSLWSKKPGNGHVELVRVRVPPVGVSPYRLRVEWQTNLGVEWRLVRERVVTEYSDPLYEVVNAGDVGSTKGTWQQYFCESDGWEPGDMLCLEAAVQGAGEKVQKISVRLVQGQVLAPTPRIVSNLGQTPLCFKGGETSRVIHFRNWTTTLRCQADRKIASNLFIKAHDIFVHGGARQGKFLLEWNVAVRTLDGQVLKSKTAGMLGVEWKIVKNGSNQQVLRGAQHASRCTPHGVLAQTWRNHASYSVDLSPLHVFVGDVVSLWLKVPGDALHKKKRPLDISLAMTQLVLDSHVQVPRLELAGRDPFSVGTEAFTWA